MFKGGSIELSKRTIQCTVATVKYGGRALDAFIIKFEAVWEQMAQVTLVKIEVR